MSSDVISAPLRTRATSKPSRLVQCSTAHRVACEGAAFAWVRPAPISHPDSNRALSHHRHLQARQAPQVVDQENHAPTRGRSQAQRLGTGIDQIAHEFARPLHPRALSARLAVDAHADFHLRRPKAVGRTPGLRGHAHTASLLLPPQVPPNNQHRSRQHLAVPVTSLKGWRSPPDAVGTVHAVRAVPIDASRSTASSAARRTSSRVPPCWAT